MRALRSLVFCVVLSGVAACRGQAGGNIVVPDGGGQDADGGGAMDTGGGVGPDVRPPEDGPSPPRDTGGTTEDPCAVHRDCERCTGQSECGWCAGRCWRGTSSGPVAGSCGGTPWAWTAGMCSGTSTGDAGVTMACQTCGFRACEPQITACLGDAACFGCLMNPMSPACATNTSARALLACICESCRTECGPACGGGGG